MCLLGLAMIKLYTIDVLYSKRWEMDTLDPGFSIALRKFSEGGGTRGIKGHTNFI